MSHWLLLLVSSGSVPLTHQAKGHEHHRTPWLGKGQAGAWTSPANSVGGFRAALTCPDLLVHVYLALYSCCLWVGLFQKPNSGAP